MPIQRVNENLIAYRNLIPKSTSTTDLFHPEEDNPSQEKIQQIKALGQTNNEIADKDKENDAEQSSEVQTLRTDATTNTGSEENDQTTEVLKKDPEIEEQKSEAAAEVSISNDVMKFIKKSCYQHSKNTRTRNCSFIFTSFSSLKTQ